MSLHGSCCGFHDIWETASLTDQQPRLCGPMSLVHQTSKSLCRASIPTVHLHSGGLSCLKARSQSQAPLFLFPCWDDTRNDLEFHKMQGNKQTNKARFLLCFKMTWRIITECWALWGREVQGGGAMCIHTADSLCWTAETNTILQGIYRPIKLIQKILAPFYTGRDQDPGRSLSKVTQLVSDPTRVCSNSKIFMWTHMTPSLAGKKVNRARILCIHRQFHKHISRRGYQLHTG